MNHILDGLIKHTLAECLTRAVDPVRALATFPADVLLEKIENTPAVHREGHALLLDVLAKAKELDALIGAMETQGNVILKRRRETEAKAKYEREMTEKAAPVDAPAPVQKAASVQAAQCGCNACVVDRMQRGVV